MKQFLLRLHYLITNPNAFVLSYTVEPVRKVFGYFVAVFITMLVATSLFRTSVVIRDLPGLVGTELAAVSIVNGKLHAPKTIVPEAWRVEEINALFNGRSVSKGTFVDSMIVIDPTGKTRADILLTADSLLVWKSKDKQGRESYLWGSSWKKLTEGYAISLDDATVQNWVNSSRISLFISLMFSHTLQSLGDFINLWILLFLVILLYRRELRTVWVKKSTIRVLMNGTMPYFVLMPLFALAGEHAELLVTTAAIVATFVIARAFSYHRAILFSASTKDDSQE